MSKRGIDTFFSSPAKKQKQDLAPTSNGKVKYDTHKSYPIPLPSAFPFDIVLNDAHKTITDKTDLDLLYYQPLFPAPTATQLFHFLRDEFPWYRVTYQVRGLTINTPRYTTVFGLDQTHAFSPTTGGGGIIEVESGAPPKKPLKCTPRPIPGCLHHLRRLVEAQVGAEYNFCLLNYYKDGTDSISYHSDDEHFLGPDPNIASISLGAHRDFLMRHKTDHSVRWKCTLRSGDTLVMRSRTQAKWDHSVPKRKGSHVTGRINITFRKAVVRYGTENYYRYNVHDGPYYRWDAQQGRMVLGSTWQPKNLPSQAAETKEVLRSSASEKGTSAASDAATEAKVDIQPSAKEEESFDVQDAVAAIEAATAKDETNDRPLEKDIGPAMSKEDSFDLEAQIRAIDEAVARAQA